ncbi:MAG: dTDP-4-dehydrorhamnose 3,5-epimerase family protein [Candidatus Fermentibacteria bacterium]
MKIEKTGIEGVRLYGLTEYPDKRGSFLELFRKEWIPEVFGDRVQVNCSRSDAGVIRGLHYHERQWDFWIPLSGRMTAGLADLRKDSSTYGKSLSLVLNTEKPAGLLIPPGVAHGFAAVTDIVLVYVVSNYFDNTDEHGIAWNDPIISIKWGIENPVVSERDILNKPYNWD